MSPELHFGVSQEFDETMLVSVMPAYRFYPSFSIEKLTMFGSKIIYLITSGHSASLKEASGFSQMKSAKADFIWRLFGALIPPPANI